MLTFGCIAAGTCVRIGLCSGGHGVPPLPLYGFIFITAGTRVLVGLCMAGVEACHYAGWYLICLSLRQNVTSFRFATSLVRGRKGYI